MRVNEKGQVTIPRRIRERLGVRPGTEVRFREWNHTIIVEKVGGKTTPFQELYGLLTSAPLAIKNVTRSSRPCSTASL